MTHDAFATTRNTWIREQLDARGEQGRREVTGYLLGTYAPALRVYFLGSSFRSLGDADEIVHGFLANRLSRDDYLEKWRGSGMRLRRWLINGLCFYCRELIADARSEARAGMPLESEPVADVAEPGADMDREFVRSVVLVAMETAAAQCAERGLSQHWDLFRRHHLGAQDLGMLARESALPIERVRVMIRSAERRFIEAVKQALARDGVVEGDMRSEIRTLIEAAGR